MSRETFRKNVETVGECGDCVETVWRVCGEPYPEETYANPDERVADSQKKLRELEYG